MVDTPPTGDKILQPGQRTWEIPEHRPNPTFSRAAFKTYSTYVHHTHEFTLRLSCLTLLQHPA